jgi:hypothetical protein
VPFARRHESVPQLARHLVAGDQLIAALAGVAGATDDDAGALEAGLDERHVVVPRRQPHLRQYLVGLRALQGQHGVRRVVVDDLDALGRCLGQAAHDLGRVRGVGHQQDVLLVVEVGDQVIDDATGRVVAAEGVLGLAGLDLGEVVAEGGVDVVGGAGTADHGLAEVADVEEPDRLADGGVLLDDAGGVLQRHAPPAELGELRTERDVPVVQRGLEQRHGANLPRP